MYLQSIPGINASTESILDGPIFQPMDDCHITVWANLEGNSTITLNAERINSVQTPQLLTYPIIDNAGYFSYYRHVISIPNGGNSQFRLYFKGIFVAVIQYKLVMDLF